MAGTETRMDFSSVSSELQLLQRGGSNGEREESAAADRPQRNQHLCMKSFFLTVNFVFLLVVQ